MTVVTLINKKKKWDVMKLVNASNLRYWNITTPRGVASINSQGRGMSLVTECDSDRKTLTEATRSSRCLTSNVLYVIPQQIPKAIIQLRGVMGRLHPKRDFRIFQKRSTSSDKFVGTRGSPAWPCQLRLFPLQSYKEFGVGSGRAGG
ncbi:hypothetical protein OUZ56_002098 [Daphnia magna]|uniref:Uncharacterized protein n=1 Tax=Daphnia magna TaxID=35525 RepID=A0ABR0A4N9_9CRUS|nr:hypothetical protein OUZ56_002098 [Daphnia magna]